MVSLDQKPESKRITICPSPRPGAPGDQLFDKAPRPARGVGRALAHAGMEDLAGVGPRRQDRVVTEVLGVAIAGALLVLARTSQIVESTSTTRRCPAGPVPSAQARRATSPITSSSWRTWPKLKAEGRCRAWRAPSPGARAPWRSPARSTSAWSMWVAPATIACTRLSTLRPGRKPPTRHRQVERRVASGSRGRAGCTTVATSKQAGVGHEVRLVEGHLDPVDAARYWSH